MELKTEVFLTNRKRKLIIGQFYNFGFHCNWIAIYRDLLERNSKVSKVLLLESIKGNQQSFE